MTECQITARSFYRFTKKSKWEHQGHRFLYCTTQMWAKMSTEMATKALSDKIAQWQTKTFFFWVCCLFFVLLHSSSFYIWQNTQFTWVEQKHEKLKNWKIRRGDFWWENSVHIIQRGPDAGRILPTKSYLIHKFKTKTIYYIRSIR